MNLHNSDFEPEAIIKYSIDPVLRCNHNLKECSRSALGPKYECKFAIYRHVIGIRNDDKLFIVCLVGPMNDSGESRDIWAQHIVNCLNENLNLIG